MYFHRGVTSLVKNPRPTLVVRRCITSGYPKEAITGKLIYEKDTKGELKSTEKAYIIEKPPIEEATQGILDRWVAKRYILFYAARYDSGV